MWKKQLRSWPQDLDLPSPSHWPLTLYRQPYPKTGSWEGPLPLLWPLRCYTEVPDVMLLQWLCDLNFLQSQFQSHVLKNSLCALCFIIFAGEDSSWVNIHHCSVMRTSSAENLYLFQSEYLLAVQPLASYLTLLCPVVSTCKMRVI